MNNVATEAHENYEFTGETKVNSDGVTVKRIRALVDIPGASVKAGDLGGWIESAVLNNGDAQVTGNAQVYGKAQIYGYERVHGNNQVSGTEKVID